MSIIDIFKKHSFELLLGLCIIFILIYGLYRNLNGSKGTWSSNYTYRGISDDIKYVDTYENKRGAPKESKGEKQCRYIMQSIFNKPFTNQRPNFLRSVTGNNLELDCYNEELKLAVEYNGAQHEKYIPYFHKNKEAFLNQLYRDDIKRRICKDNGIYLIEVPHTVKIHDIEKYILKALKFYVPPQSYSKKI
jgi:hypothetical protein